METANNQNTSESNTVRIAHNAVYQLLRDNRRKLILRLNSNLVSDPEILAIFQNLKEQTEQLSHQRILRVAEYAEDSDGGYWTVEDENMISLSSYLKQKPQALADNNWKDMFISQLTDCIEHLHKRSKQAVELNLHSIMVTTTNGHNVRLLPPCDSFLFKKSLIWEKRMPYLAPELQQEEDITTNVDLYGIGYIIKALYPAGGIPYKYREAIRIATNNSRDKRFTTTGDMTRMIEKDKKRESVRSYISSFALVALIVGVVIVGFSLDGGEETRTKENYKENKSDVYADTLSEYEKLMKEVDKYLEDTTSVAEVENDALSGTSLGGKNTNKSKIIQAYVEDFRAQALPLVKRIYDSKMMEGNQEDYIQNAEKISLEIQRLQNNLCTKYELDRAVVNNISNQIILELSDQCMKK